MLLTTSARLSRFRQGHFRTESTFPLKEYLDITQCIEWMYGPIFLTQRLSGEFQKKKKKPS